MAKLTAEAIRDLKTQHAITPNLTPDIPKVVVSLFDGAGTIWQILDKIGLTPEYRFSCEANPYQIALLGARYGYRNPPAWLKEADPEGLGRENPQGLIHLGAILPGGKFEYEGKQYTCQEMVDLYTGQQGTHVSMFVGGPVCNSNSGLAHVDSSAENATSNVAGDFYVDAAKSVRAVNPDVKMVVENVRNAGKNANNYNSKVQDAFGTKDNPYYNTTDEEYTYTDEQGNKQKGIRTVTDVSNKAGLSERIPQWLDVNTPVEHAMNRIRSIWTNYRLTPEVYNEVVQNLRTGKKKETPNTDVFGDGWLPIRGGKLGTIVGNSGIDKDQAAKLQEHIAMMDAAGTLLARHDDEGAYLLTEDGRPGIIASRMPKLSKKILTGATESVDHPDYGKVLLWAAPVSKKDPTIRRPTLPRTHLQPGKPYDVRFTSLDEGDELMWDTHDLARVPEHVDKYIQANTETLYPQFMRFYTNKKGEEKKKSQKHGKQAVRYSQGASWNIHTLLPIILGLLQSNQKIDPELGYEKGGYVQPPNLATHIKALGRY
jgi:hypothetical protein